jgi:methylated-DNA-[protein]-cysteine S-methyltransferase
MKKLDCIRHYQTGLGIGAVAVNQSGVCQVWLPGDKLPEQTRSDSALVTELAEEAAKQLKQYFDNGRQQFDLTVDISQMTPFRQRVLQQTMLIPYGTVISYGKLAELVGSPRAARAAGGALAANPVPVIIPCHRIVAGDGALTGFSAIGGISMKKNLLLMEGVDLKGFKKDCPAFGYTQKDSE